VDSVTIVLHPERPVVRKDAVNELDIVVEVSSRPGDSQIRPSGPMNLCLVIDRSGSMQGTKLSTATKSCVDIFRRLGPTDLLTVVTFDEDAEVIINPQTPRDEVEQRLRNVAPGGMTNLSLGWYQGLLELQTQTTESYYNRLFLLSDGQANAGETKRAVFADTAARARDVGITASTIGIGRDFQEDLLETIASSSGGRFWNIGESDIEDIIEEEFEGALSVLFDRPRIALSLPPGTRISRELNQLRKISRGYRIRPLQREDTFNFAIRLEVDPEQVDGDRLAIGATLFDGDREITSGQLSLTLGTRQEVAASPAHPLVRSTVQQFERTVTDEVMLADIDAGRMTELREMLTGEIAKLQARKAELGRMNAGQLGDLNLTVGRAAIEIEHLRHNAESMSALEVCLDMVTPYADEPPVASFLRFVRKNMKREGQRNMMRRLVSTPWDSDAPVILEALALADLLIDQHPENADRLNYYRETLRGFLDHQ
jgi:uncharacterized protein YegL